jgi:putative Mn2+ efflux pump MntP
MPIAGWLAGLTLARWLGGLDAWAAFGLLAWIGGRMVLAGLRGGARDQAADPTRGLSLVALSVATSLDALAVGVSLGVLGVAIWGPALVIGLVAAALTAAGLHLARPLGRLGPRAGRAMEIAGGLVLVAIGLRILLEGGPR